MKWVSKREPERVGLFLSAALVVGVYKLAWTDFADGRDCWRMMILGGVREEKGEFVGKRVASAGSERDESPPMRVRVWWCYVQDGWMGERKEGGAESLCFIVNGGEDEEIGDDSAPGIRVDGRRVEEEASEVAGRVRA